MNAVGFVGGAGHDFAQENNALVFFADEDVVIFDAGEGEGDVGQLVIVGGEQGFGFDAGIVVQVFRHGPGDGNAVEGGGAAADFVEHNQRARRGIVEDVGGFLHFHHECGAAARQIVARSDAREDAVHHADFGGRGGNERAHLRHDDDEGHLADIGGFSGHVRAGDNQELMGVIVKLGVVGHKAVGLREQFDDRVTAVANHQRAILGHFRADIATG